MEKKRLFYNGYWSKDELIKNKLIIDKIDAGIKMFKGDFYILYNNEHDICTVEDIDAGLEPKDCPYGKSDDECVSEIFRYNKEEKSLDSIYVEIEKTCDKCNK